MVQFWWIYDIFEQVNTEALTHTGDVKRDSTTVIIIIVNNMNVMFLSYIFLKVYFMFKFK